MPCIIVHRNFPVEKKKVMSVQERITSLVEEVLGKPKAFIMVICAEQESIRFGGSDEKALFIELKSVGLPGDAPSQLSRELSAAAEDILSVPQDRIYIEFSDSPGSMWGWNGGTF